VEVSGVDAPPQSTVSYGGSAENLVHPEVALNSGINYLLMKDGAELGRKKGEINRGMGCFCGGLPRCSCRHERLASLGDRSQGWGTDSNALRTYVYAARV
jgi:hypothetical protein